MPNQRTDVVHGTLALIAGGGGFAAMVKEKLKASDIPTRDYSWVRHRHETYLPHLDPLESAAILKEDGVSHVLHVGSFSIIDMIKGIRAIQSAQAVLLGAPAVRRRLFVPYDNALRSQGVVPITARDLFPEFVAPLGQIGALAASRSELELLARLVEAAHQTLANREVFASVAQAVVFDDSTVVQVEAHGTDSLLRGLRPPPASATRILIKLSPRGFPAKLDAPTIGPKTIELAAKAGVQLIGIDAEHGQLVDRWATAEAADRAGIRLLGV